MSLSKLYASLFLSNPLFYYANQKVPFFTIDCYLRTLKIVIFLILDEFCLLYNVSAKISVSYWMKWLFNIDTDVLVD